MYVDSCPNILYTTLEQNNHAYVKYILMCVREVESLAAWQSEFGS